MPDWIITVPKTVSWEDYERELTAVLDRTSVLNYRVHRVPKALRIGDRCYVVWQGRVRGWMEIVGIADHADGFVCQTTGAYWRPGVYIQRAGDFHPVAGPEMTGFQGIRSYNAPSNS